MPFASYLSLEPDTQAALTEASRHVATALGRQAEIAFVFFSPHHAESIADCPAAVISSIQTRFLIGCMGESIIGNDREIEQSPAICLWAGIWNQPVKVESFHLAVEETPEGQSLLRSPNSLNLANPETATVLLLGEPSSFPVNYFFKQLNEANKGLRVLGGMAGAGGRTEPFLLLNDQLTSSGAVGLLIDGPCPVRAIVSQGCRPIGKPMVITKAQENVILELGGKTPLVQLQELWNELSPQDQQLLRHGLHVGLVINEYQENFERGDFLVRNAIGLDRDSGALGITDRVRVGQTVRFQVRDAASADEDLHALLQKDIKAHAKRPAAALAFSCNGRGTRLFPGPHHDARAIRQEEGAIPLAGFFAQGEFGPIGGQNFIHGFTASVALFED